MDISNIRLLNQDYNIKDETARNNITNINNVINFENNKRSILLSDSYFDYSPDETITEQNRYWYKFFKMINITDYYAYNMGGIGFFQKVNNVNFQTLLENHYNDIPNKDTIKYIFVFGGYNDSYLDSTTIQNINDAINNFVAYCKTNYPNATVVIGEIGYDTNRTLEGSRRRYNINSKVIPAYCNTTYNSDYSYVYLPNLNYCLHNTLYMSTDGIHPNTTGHNQLANAIYSSFNNGYMQIPAPQEYVTCTSTVENSNANIELFVQNNIPNVSIRINTFYINFNGTLPSFTHNNVTEIASFANSKVLLPTYRNKFYDNRGI